MKKLAFALLLGALATLAQAGPRIEHWTAPSGARVFFIESRVVPIIDVQVDFAAGGAYAPANKAGLAGLTRGLLDTGAGISDVVLYTISLADEVLIVCTPEPTSLTDAYATIKVLATTQPRRLIRLLVNQVQRAGEARAIRKQLQLVVDRYVNTGLDKPVMIELLGEVPLDVAVREAVVKRELLLECAPGSAAAQAIVAAAAKHIAG